MNNVFRPNPTLEGDPQRNQNQFLVLSADEAFEITQVEYIVDGRTHVTQAVETELDIRQRLPLLQDTLRKLRQSNPSLAEWPVDVAIRCRRLGSEEIVKYSFLLQPCRKRGILKLAARKNKHGDKN